ncbi:MAG: hypothetical protein F6K10_15780 [Moorea sp. SIO2B7]|nr:hypothetical protein [Moorena sp. SIO2B7]
MVSLRDTGKIVGPSASIQQIAKNCGLSFPLSLRDFINTSGCPFSQCVRLHIKVLTEPRDFTIDEMVEAMRIVYATAKIAVQIVSRETLSGSEFNDLQTVDVNDGCIGTTAEQDELFENDNFVGTNEIVIYFVRSTDPGLNGCASYPEGKPGAIVTRTASLWTLAHEVGHVLGLNHIAGEHQGCPDSNRDCCKTADFTRLMTGCSTSNITGTPTVSSTERNRMQNSSLSVVC